MRYTLYIIVAIVFFGILIAVHEFGHFFTAKLLGVKVNEFSIGMGPALLKKQKGETLYSLRAFPIGGFCAMEGEDADSGDPRAFSVQARWKRFIILVAGSAMNFVAGMLIILVLFSQTAAFNAPVLVDIMDGAEHLTEGGLQEGDRFYRIDGHRIYFTGDVSLFMDRVGDEVDLQVLRDGELIVLDDFDFAKKVPYVTESGETVYMRGITYGAAEEATPGLILKNTWYQTVNYVRMVWLSLGDLVTGAVGLREVSGVIGIVDTVGDVGVQAGTVADGLMSVVNLMALIAINLAVMNLLPIPALDGGRIFFLIVGSLFKLIFRRELDPKYENAINGVCFVLLMGLMILIAISDVLKLAGV